jgi:hypothetical protein
LRQLLQGPVTKHSLTKLDVSRCPGFSQAGLIVPPLVSLQVYAACLPSEAGRGKVHSQGTHQLVAAASGVEPCPCSR